MKRILLSMIVALCCNIVYAEILSGNCGKNGDNLTWTLDTSTGLLKIEGSGDMADYDSTSDIPWYTQRTNIIMVELPNGLASIGDGAFYYCNGITTINIPNTVTSIGKWAFYNCSGLLSVDIPGSVTIMKQNAFDGCSGLTSLTIPNSVINIDDYVFQACKSLSSVIIPNSVTSIGNWAFNYCDKLTSLTIPNSVTKIGGSAFRNCDGLTTMTIPNSVTSMGTGVFYGCDRLVSVSIPNSVTNIPEATFAYCPRLNAIDIPNSVTTIEYEAFRECTGLTSITIPNSVTNIENSVFYKCYNLTSVNIPNLVTRIGENAFSYCSNLTSVTIPESCKTVSKYAFYKCYNLTTLKLPSSAIALYDYSFGECSALKDIWCQAETPPVIYANTFSSFIYDKATLNVPTGCGESYKAHERWGLFSNILAGGAVPELLKCAVPTITYSGKKITFDCSTENVSIHYGITPTDNKSGVITLGDVEISGIYKITAYATKSGYEDSDIASATLVWATATLNTDDITSAKSISVDSTPLLITQDDGVLTVSGLKDGETITAYSSDGKQVATSKAIGDAALLNLSELQGKVAVLSVGGKSAKVMVK